MKIGRNKLQMSDGSIRTFRSQKARDNFEHMAEAVKHGFKPTRNNARHRRMKKGRE